MEIERILKRLLTAGQHNAKMNDSLVRGMESRYLLIIQADGSGHIEMTDGEDVDVVLNFYHYDEVTASDLATL